MHKDQVHDHLIEITKSFFGEIDPNYDPKTDNIPQGIYRSHEIPIAEFLMSYRDSLIKDFLKGYASLEDAVNDKCHPVLQKREDRKPYFDQAEYDEQITRFPDESTEFIRTLYGDESIPNPNGWKNLEFKYHCPFENIHWDMDREHAKTNYPTAFNLIEQFGDDCPIASYSYMAPNTILHRHTGPENRLGEYIRLHIPLIIPEGDVFFECNGEEVTWDNVFGFDNQLAHSAHNLSNGHRLIFLIDFRRSRIGMPPGQEYNKDRQLYSVATSFVRQSKK